MYGQKSYGYDEIGNITFKDRANYATFDSVTTIYVDNHYEKEGSTVRTYKAFVRTPLRRVAMRDGSTLYYILTDHGYLRWLGVHCHHRQQRSSNNVRICIGQ